MHCFTHEPGVDRGARAACPGTQYATACSSTTRTVGQAPEGARRRSGSPNDTIVRLHDGQRPQRSGRGRTAATTPFRSEKDTNWEGAFRVPAMIRWPGHGQARNGLQRDGDPGLDWLPDAPRGAGDTTIKERLLKGWAPKAGGLTYKVHLDGYNLVPYLRESEEHRARHDFYYFNDDGMLCVAPTASRRSCEQRGPGWRSAQPVHVCARPRCTSCAWTRSSAPTSYRTVLLSQERLRDSVHAPGSGFLRA